MKEPNIHTNPELLAPAPDVLLALIKAKGGMTLNAIHQLGYRSVYNSLRWLREEEFIFEHNGCYLPNR